MVWGTIASVGSSLISSALGSSSARDQQKQQVRFAKNAIQWRVADAQKAGIHPLYALGAVTPSYSPVANYSGEGIAQAGQDISRAYYANRDARERRSEVHAQLVRQQMQDDRDTEIHGLSVERARLENDLLRSQVARANSAQLGPGAPDASPGSVQRVPARVEVGSPGNPARSPGEITDYQYFRHEDGSLGLIPSEQMKERIEDNLPGEIGWWLRNNIMPIVTTPRNPSSQYPLPRNYQWEWNGLRQRWEARNLSTPRKMTRYANRRY